MRKVIQDSILNAVEKANEALKTRDAFTLKKLSNYTIHNSSIFQDEDSVSIAIILYSISKLLDREKMQVDDDDETIIKSLSVNLNQMLKALQIDDIELYRKKTKNIFKFINRLDKNTSDYIDEVIVKSKIKKGTAMFEHGISLSQVSEILGISKWEIQDYVGNTSSIEKEPYAVKKEKKRLKFAENLFGL